MVRDLLPLFCDGVCGEESGAFIKEHVERCESCASELNALRIAERQPIQPTVPDDSIRAALLILKRKLTMRRVIAVLAAIVLTILLIVVANLYLQQYVPLPYTEGMLSVAVADNGELSIIANNNTFFSCGSTQHEMEKDGEVYTAVYFRYLEQLYSRLPWRKPSPMEMPMKVVVGITGSLESFSDEGASQEMLWNLQYNQSFAENIGAVYYFDESFSKLGPMEDDAAFAEATKNAVLVWER